MDAPRHKRKGKRKVCSSAPSPSRLGVLVALMAGVSSALVWSRANDKNLVFNGDFELSSPQSPPPGWAMWGAERFKVPAHFTRDTTQPHNGQACFRIFHPANTGGYVVTDPAYAIRPQRGMAYRIVFWARADKPGRSLFGVTAYENIRPFVDAPSPGFFPIDVNASWRQFAFEIHEGFDFFAERSRHLLLTFKTTTDEKEERTLWIDDVSVTASPSTKPRLVDETTLSYQPLQHRLRPGEKLDFTVDASKRLRRATREAGGVSFHRVAGWTGHPYSKQGEFTLPPQTEEAIREMRLPMTRFYAVGDEPFGVEAAIDKVAEMCRRSGIAEEWTVLELEEQGANTKLPPDVWERAVRYAQQKRLKFRYWEIANEPYSSLWGHGKAFASPDDYVQHVKAVSAAIRRANPTARVGIAVAVHNQKWGNYVLQQTAGCYDFVVGHYYAFPNVHRSKFEDVVLTETVRTLDAILRFNALIKAYNPGRQIDQLDTEWGLHASGPNGERADYVDRNANVVGTLHRAVRLVYYAREGMLLGASGWQMLSRTGGQGFGILFPDAPGKQSMLYWLYYHFNRHVGEWVVDIEGTAPYHVPERAEARSFSAPMTPVLATCSKDGRTLYLVIVNASSLPVPCRAEMRNFRPAEATQIALSHADLDGKPLLERAEDFVVDFPMALIGDQLDGVLPPHSVVFMTVRKKE